MKMCTGTSIVLVLTISLARFVGRVVVVVGGGVCVNDFTVLPIGSCLV